MNNSVFKPVTKAVRHKWDHMIEGYFDACKKTGYRSMNKFYLQGYKAKEKGLVMSDELVRYINGNMR